MKKTTAQIFSELREYVGPLQWELGEVIADAALGADILDPGTKELITQLFASMPESDNLTLENIAENIHAIGDPFAEGISHDILMAATDLD